MGIEGIEVSISGSLKALKAQWAQVALRAPWTRGDQKARR